MTGPLVHTTWGHLAWDGTILVLLGWSYEPRLRGAWPALFAAGLVAPLAVELALSPDLTAYYGTSGLTHTLMAAAVVFELAHRRRTVPDRHASRFWSRFAARAGSGRIIPVGIQGLRVDRHRRFGAGWRNGAQGEHAHHDRRGASGLCLFGLFQGFPEWADGSQGLASWSAQRGGQPVHAHFPAEDELVRSERQHDGDEHRQMDVEPASYDQECDDQEQEVEAQEGNARRGLRVPPPVERHRGRVESDSPRRAPSLRAA